MPPEPTTDDTPQMSSRQTGAWFVAKCGGIRLAIDEQAYPFFVQMYEYRALREGLNLQLIDFALLTKRPFDN